MILPTFFLARVSLFGGGVSGRLRVLLLLFGFLDQGLLLHCLFFDRGVYMHEKHRHERLWMQMYALDVDEVQMPGCSIYFMENDVCIAVKSTFMYIFSVNHVQLWIKTCIWVLAVPLTQMVPNFYDKQIFHTQSYCQNFSSIGVIIILLKFQQVFSPTLCQNFHKLLERFLKVKFYQWAILSMSYRHKNL